MAERRMFAKTIIDSDAFLDMPLSSQAFYFHLSMRADDDGFINNPKKIQRMVGASDDDFKLLIAKSFLIPFENGIVVIKHWKIHNYIQSDRYKETVYLEEKGMLKLKENKAYTLDENSMDTQCIQDVSNMETQVRLGKDSLDKDSIELISSKKEKREIKPTGTDIEVINYLNLVCEKRYRPSKSNIKYIHGRFNDGFTIEDLKRVIDIKASKWKNDPKMNDYLRPSTLFNSDNFEAYLNEKPREMPIDTLITDNSDVESWVNKDGTE